ncbi:hypothetical protein [Zavarzinia sp.]|uniref:hypothetical protein n=1 Tax=Zavarzinia sp. TaxID=2027920 RepID=UPI003565D9F6
MGFGIRDWGLILSRTAAQATGTATIAPATHGLLRTRIKLEVDSSAGWSGTLTVTPTRQGTLAETATTVVVGGLTASGTGGYADIVIDHAASIVVSVADNDKVMRVYARSVGIADEGAVL